MKHPKELDQKKGLAGVPGGILMGGLIGLFTLGTVLAFVIIILVNLQAQTTDATAISAINATVVALATLPTWFSLLILIFVMVVIFGALALGIYALTRLGGGSML